VISLEGERAYRLPKGHFLDNRRGIEQAGCQGVGP
jgi:hypothetical protein